MSDSEYIKIFEGNSILIQRIIGELNNNGINPVIKDEAESYRLAGFGTLNQGFQEVYVHKDELTKAKQIVAAVKAELEI